VRVGVFGLLGSGNLGNDGSLEAVLGYLRAEHPEAVVDALCGGPRSSTAVRDPRHAAALVPRTSTGPRRGRARSSGKGLGKLVDVFRTAAWVRRHDVVIVPGMGVLEATLPLRPWGFPYSLFLLCATGRLFGTRRSRWSASAPTRSRDRPTRALVRWSARLAAYRSYRDDISRDAMRAMGVDTSARRGLPGPRVRPAARRRAALGPPGTVGVGVMAYHGGNDDRAGPSEIYRHYLDTTNRFVRWLVEEGRPVRLFIGDESTGRWSPRSSTRWTRRWSPLLRAGLAGRPDERDGGGRHRGGHALPQRALRAEGRQADRRDQLRGEERRAHGRDGPRRVLPAAREVDADRLVEQFPRWRNRSAELRQTLAERNEDNAARQLEDQFTELTAALFGADHVPHRGAR
jgi:hypothetical protein